MRTFGSNKEFFDWLADLARRFQQAGRAEVVQRLEEAARSINGLTDGWDLFAREIERILGIHGDELSDADINDLRAALGTAYDMVYR